LKYACLMGGFCEKPLHLLRVRSKPKPRCEMPISPDFGNHRPRTLIMACLVPAAFRRSGKMVCLGEPRGLERLWSVGEDERKNGSGSGRDDRIRVEGGFTAEGRGTSSASRAGG